jgi:cold shock CspA family protein
MTDNDEREQSGIVRNFDSTKKFGFIDDAFFHLSTVPDDIKHHIRNGLRVNYREYNGEKGKVADILSAAEELPESEPFSGEFTVVDPEHIMLENMIEQIRAIVEENGCILIPGILKKFEHNFEIEKTKEHNARNKIESYLKSTFREMTVARYDLFSAKKKQDGTTINAHPFLQETSPFLWLIRKQNVQIQFNPKKEIPESLLQFIYLHTINSEEGYWVVVGDETGTLGEFRGERSRGRQSAMCWVVIPPNSSLPGLPSKFHVHDDEDHMALAVNNLIEDSGVQIYQFQYSSGRIVEGVPPESAQVHLNLWKDTLPLILNKISNHDKGIPKIRIYIERVGNLEPGLNPVAGLLSNWKLAMGKHWVDIDTAKVLAKNPLEHPWLGYPDAVGFINSPRNWKDPSLKERINSLAERMVQAPYRQDVLGKVNGLFMTPQPEVQFVKALFDFPQRDMKEYIVEYYGHQLKHRINVLSERDWYTILEEMEQHSGSLQGQNATSVIFDHTDIDKTLSNLKTDSLKFNFLMALLGCSNHNGDTDRSQFCKINIVELIESEFEPTRQQRMHFLNLSNGANDNEFDFSIDDDEIHSLIEEIKDGFQDDIERKLAGAYAQTLALRGTDDDLSIAWEIEDLLREDSARDPYNPNHARRLNIKSELLLAKKQYVQARNFLEIDIPQELNCSVQQLLRQDGFFVAALLKACALCEEDSTKFSVYSTFVPALLDNRHPSQRIAYWTARWAWQVGRENDPVVQQCLDHLIHMTTNEIFTKEAPGLILSCELMDLYALGLIEFDVQKFHNTMLQNSTASTRLWVEQHLPNHEDWLAPLTYNYR